MFACNIAHANQLGNLFKAAGVSLSLIHISFEFLPEFKIAAFSNHKLKVSDDSDGFWRKFFLVPFDHTFVKTGASNYAQYKACLLYTSRCV